MQKLLHSIQKNAKENMYDMLFPKVCIKVTRLNKENVPILDNLQYNMVGQWDYSMIS